MARKCLVCEAPITRMQMKIDACRACAVFYRRNAKSTEKFTCKFTAGGCVKNGRVLECRKCRFDLMNSIFDRAKKEEIGFSPNSECKSREESSEPFEPLASVPAPSLPGSPTTPAVAAKVEAATTSGPISEPSTSGMEVLKSISRAYDVMTRVRRTAEICMRPRDQFVHPKQIDDNSFTILPAQHGNTVAMKQIELSSLYDFASIAFPEFTTLSQDEKWRLISGSCERMGIMESTYRSMKMFPDTERVFVSYTTTLSPESLDKFFDDCSLTVGNKNAADALRQNLSGNAERCKRAMNRVDPSEEEFHALLALSFWNNDIQSGDERLFKMTTSNRAAIMQDLHEYYSIKGVTNYAGRIGDLFCLLVDNERVASLITEDIQLLRLMDVNHPPKY